MEKYLTPEFLQIFLPLILGVVLWFLNERSKRKWEEYQKKEEHYSELLRAIRGFYVETHDQKLKDEFLEQLKQCWLYCPDEVISSAYAFLNSVHAQKVSTDDIKERSLGDFIIAIRRDLLSRKITRKTKLTANDYQHLRIT
jgi:Pyruvate/2-oxoacid:ferredoxin oxidoreductase delta subunit